MEIITELELEQIAAGAVVIIVAWLGWPVAQRIRAAAMIDIGAMLEDVKSNVEILAGQTRSLEQKVNKMDIRLTKLESQSD